MTLEHFRSYCIAKPGVTEDFPFDDVTLTMKVMGKMFAICDISSFERINVKCDPDLAIELREQYDSVQPGWHMNKHHWNTVYLDGGVEDRLVHEWIDHSYDLIVKGLTKKLRAELENL